MSLERDPVADRVEDFLTRMLVKDVRRPPQHEDVSEVLSFREYLEKLRGSRPGTER